MSSPDTTTFTGRVYGTGAWAGITVQRGLIREVRPVPAPDGPERWVVPGFFDLQVNGFAGRDFCRPDVTIEDIEAAARAMLATGTTRFLPTVITGGLDDLCRELRVISMAIEMSPLVRQMCPGAHVEGPFIHPEDGPRGAHPRQHVRPPHIGEFDRLYEAAGGRISILTVAADQPGSSDLIAHAAGKGVLVAIGHHRAESAHVQSALSAGARMCTHLGNGYDAVVPRLDNTIWRQLGEDRLWASFIADGHHLPPATLKCMLRAKTLDRSVLVTDAMTAAGMPPGRYKIGGIEADRTPEGKVVLPGTPYLAGSAAEMPLCVTTAIRFGGLSLEEAVRLASLNPAHLLLGEPLTWSPQVNTPANFALVEWDVANGSLRVLGAAAGAFAAAT